MWVLSGLDVMADTDYQKATASDRVVVVSAVARSVFEAPRRSSSGMAPQLDTTQIFARIRHG